MAKLPWLRLYTDTVDNEKIRLLAFEDRWHYIALLCLMQQGVLDNDNELLARKIAVKLGVQLPALQEIKKRLMDVELIRNDFRPVGWNKKQYKSDSSVERVRKHRKNKDIKECNVTETLLKRKCNALDTDTDTDTEQKKKRISRRFTPPTLTEIKEYIKEKKYYVDGDRFYNFYESKDWMIGTNKMKKWKAALANWNKKSEQPENKFSGMI